jgi:hypothetical protein
MPDGSMRNLARQTQISTPSQASKDRMTLRIHFDWSAGPVELGLVTTDQFLAMRRHFAAMDAREVKGEADPGALHVMTTMNGWPNNPPIYRGSMRYWWLMAFNEREWVACREGCLLSPVSRRKLTVREKAAEDLYSAMTRLRSLKSKYYNYSRFCRLLAEDCQSHDAVARWDSIDREERKEAVMQWRAQSRKPMKAALAAIARYEAMFRKEGAQ